MRGTIREVPRTRNMYHPVPGRRFPASFGPRIIRSFNGNHICIVGTDYAAAASLA